MEWYKLRMAGVRDCVIRNLMERFENYEDIFNFDKFTFINDFQIKEEEYLKIIESKNMNLKEEIEKLSKKDIKILSFKSSDYPENLKNIAQPPVFLYYRGDITLLKKRIIGVVGTRRATTYGRVACEKFSQELVENGIVTASGLALGIDGICHKRTLEKKGKTIAVVGSGLDIIYPRENKVLWELIGKNGLILSEFSLGAEPMARNFPMRNRIIAGISKGILVVESKKSGGSLITAEIALEEGRDVFAVPGDIFSPVSEGCNDLIKNSQAKLVTSVADILAEYDWKKIEKLKAKIDLTPQEEKIYSVLETELTLDEIIMKTSIKAGEALAILMDLELKKLVASVAGGKYRRKAYVNDCCFFSQILVK